MAVFTLVISCNFLATAAAIFFVFTAASSGLPAIWPSRKAFAYMRFIRSFCNFFLAAFFCIPGFSSIYFWLRKRLSAFIFFFSSFAAFSVFLQPCFLKFPATNPKNSSDACSVLCAASTPAFSFSVSAILPCIKFLLSIPSLFTAFLATKAFLHVFSVSTATST